jgi:predicted kinase
MKQKPQPTLFIFMGLPACGKSTLAKAWSQRHNFAYFNSDVVRKQLTGESEFSRQRAPYGKGIYTSEMTGRTYDALLTYSIHELAASKTVVLDACYGSRNQRRRLVRVTDVLNATLCFISCSCSEKVTKRRLAKRDADTTAVSDADWEIYKKQREKFEPLNDIEAPMAISINMNNTLEQLIKLLENALAP